MFLAQNLRMDQLLLVERPSAPTVSADYLPAGNLLGMNLSAGCLSLVVPAAGIPAVACLPVERHPALEAPAMKLAVACSLLLTLYLMLGLTQ